MLAICVGLSVAALGLADRIRDPIADTLRRTILAPLVSLQHDAELTRIAWLSRSVSTQVADSIAMRALALPAAEAENNRLRKMLGLTTRIQWGFVSAEVLRGRGLAEDYTVTLSSGSQAGVRAFSPVVAAEGLVGLVKSVDPTMST